MSKRRVLDAYYTPEHLIEPLLEHVKPHGRMLEPCCGDGSISRLLELIPRTAVLTNDIDLKVSADTHYDASDASYWMRLSKSTHLDWVITNPPFSKAKEILEHSLRYADNVALLLRLSFLEPTFERQDLLSECPPDAMIVLPRYSFTGDGKSDSVTCAWMIWSDMELPHDKRGIFVHRKQRASKSSKNLFKEFS